MAQVSMAQVSRASCSIYIYSVLQCAGGVEERHLHRHAVGMQWACSGHAVGMCGGHGWARSGYAVGMRCTCSAHAAYPRRGTEASTARKSCGAALAAAPTSSPPALRPSSAMDPGLACLTEGGKRATLGRSGTQPPSPLGARPGSPSPPWSRASHLTAG